MKSRMNIKNVMLAVSLLANIILIMMLVVITKDIKNTNDHLKKIVILR